MKRFAAIKQATVAIVKLNTEDATEPFTIIGSGVCIDSTGVIATCRHVIDAFLEKPIEEQITGLPVDGKMKKIPTKFLTPHAVFLYSRSDRKSASCLILVGWIR